MGFLIGMGVKCFGVGMGCILMVVVEVLLKCVWFDLDIVLICGLLIWIFVVNFYDIV